MTMNREPDWERSEPAPEELPVPPKIVDQLFADPPPEPVEAPPVSVGPPDRRPLFSDPAAGRARDARATGFPLTVRQRNFLMAGVVSALTLNVALLVLLLMMFQERTPRPAPAPTPPAVPEAAPEAERRGPSQTVERRDPGIAPAAPETPYAAPDDPGPFRISKLVLCRSVNGYGDYEPIPDIPLHARHIPFILAYIEIDNPTPERRTDNRHLYHMTKYMVLYRSDSGPSQPLMDSALSLVKGGGMSPRRDLYAAHHLQTMGTVEAGEYTLRIRVADHVSGQTATAEASFMVHAH